MSLPTPFEVQLNARVSHYMRSPDMPFDGVDEARRPTPPERPEKTNDEIRNDYRDAVILDVQENVLKRPVTWSEYELIWNRVTKHMGWSDYLDGQDIVGDAA
jgi:hypothetical protein